MKNVIRVAGLVCGLLLADYSAAVARAGEPDDVIARVGDEVIHFHELDTAIDSSAMIGMKVPKPGTRERTNLRLTLLDREITADLLYLDALKQGLESSPVFQDDLKRFSDAILSSMYKEKYLIGDIPVSDEEIRDYFEKRIKKDTPFSQDVHMAIEATIRKEKFKKKVAAIRGVLRQGIEVKLFSDKFGPAGDKDRSSTTVVAEVAGEPVTWGDVRQDVGLTPDAEMRRKRLENIIDLRIMINKARAAGMEKDPVYQRRIKEFTKSSLANTRRAQLEDKMTPTDDELQDYFNKHRDKIVVPPMRKIQMVVLKTRDDADRVKKMIDSGALTIYQAVQKYSIAPNAKENLGEFGWVAEGTGFPGLDKVTFGLKPGEIGGPVKSPAGWHLVKVLDSRDAEFSDLKDRATRDRTRRFLLHDRLNQYVTRLRETTYQVKVYSDVFNRLTQKEVDATEAKPPVRTGSNG